MARPTDVTGYGGERDEPEPAPAEERPQLLYGRDTETEFLQRTISEVAHGPSGAALLLARESGAGKTALADWALIAARASGFHTVRATCEPFHAGMSFFPIQELSRKLAGEQGIEALIASEYGSE